MPSLMILRELDPNLEYRDRELYGFLTRTDERGRPMLPDRQRLWTIEEPPKPGKRDRTPTEHLVVHNDAPRDAEITDAIMTHTVGFIVADDDWKWVGYFRDLAKAERAIGNATWNISVEYDIPEDAVTPTDDDDPFEPMTAAPTSPSVRVHPTEVPR